jgi:hypothetical protein
MQNLLNESYTKFPSQIEEIWLEDVNINCVAFVRERTKPTERRLSAKLVPTFADRGVSCGQRGGFLRP